MYSLKQRETIRQNVLDMLQRRRYDIVEEKKQNVKTKGERQTAAKKRIHCSSSFYFVTDRLTYEAGPKPLKSPPDPVRIRVRFITDQTKINVNALASILQTEIRDQVKFVIFIVDLPFAIRPLDYVSLRPFDTHIHYQCIEAWRFHQDFLNSFVIQKNFPLPATPEQVRVLVDNFKASHLHTSSTASGLPGEVKEEKKQDLSHFPSIRVQDAACLYYGLKQNDFVITERSNELGPAVLYPRRVTKMKRTLPNR